MTPVQAESVKIRRVNRLDIDSIISLHKKIGLKESSIRNMVSLDFGGPQDFSLIALIDKKVVGVIIARLLYVYIPVIELCLVNGIIVDPDYRRYKIGTKLVHELFEYCRAEKINLVRALAEDTNTELIKFEESLGFRPSRIISWDKFLDA